MARLKFWDLFQPNPDGTLQAIRRLKIGGFTIEPGQKIKHGVLFSGFDIFQYTGRDLEVEEVEGVEVITGVY